MRTAGKMPAALSDQTDTMNTGNPKSLVSLHDVMPETLLQTTETIRFLEKSRVYPLTLLVSPGRKWSARDIADLKAFEKSGYDLAGHGWRHEVYCFATWRHRLHGRFISRREAEHFPLTPKQIAGMITDCYRWFERCNLNKPVLYVPPAWALGSVPRQKIKKLPFRYVETLTGVYDAKKDVFRLLPATGYMADTPFRAAALQLINRINRLAPLAPLRIAVHPFDIHLPLARDLKRHLAVHSTFLRYRDLPLL